MPQYFCIFSDTLIREQPSDDEYFESITFQFPITLQALKICALGSPLPGAPDAKSNTSPPNIKFEIFAVDLKNEEAVCLVPVGNGSYHSSSSSTDYHLKPIMTNQLLIRGNYTSISMALYGNSSKFKPKEEEKEEKLSSHRSARDERDRDRGSSDNDDDRYDDWAYVKHVRDSHQDKIYPITMDSDLPLSDSDEEQEPRMALPLAAPTLPQAIAAQGNPGEVKSEELDPEVKAEMEKAPPVSNRLSPMEIPSAPPKTLLPVHMLLEKNEDVSAEDLKKSNEPSLARLIAIIKELKPNSETVRKVSLLEESCESVPCWLSAVDDASAKKFVQEVASTLRSHFTNMELPPAATVRLLKAGLRLVTLIASVNEVFAKRLLSIGVLQRLTYLLTLKDFASPLQLMALNAIDQLISWPFGMNAFLKFSFSQELKGSGYEHVVRLILRKPTVRVSYACGQILTKVDIYRSAFELKNLTKKLMKASPFANINIDDDTSVPKRRDDAENVDSDTEEQSEKMEADSAEPELFECEMEHVIPYDSTVATKETVERIVELIEDLLKIVKDPSVITLLSMKELPNGSSKTISNKGRVFISRLLDSISIVKICLGLLNFPYLSQHIHVYGAVASLLRTLCMTKEGVLLFAADFNSSKLLVQSLLGSGTNPAEEAHRCSSVEPVYLAMILATSLQTVGFLDELVNPAPEKWSNKYWSPLQGVMAVFSGSDYLSEQAANICAYHCRQILNVMKTNGPASIQAAELLHSALENSSNVSWLESHMAELNLIMEGDNQILDVFNKVFTGQVQFTIKNALVNIRRLAEVLEFGVSLEIIHGPSMSFYVRMLESLLDNEQSIMTGISNNIIDVLTATLESISKCITFNCIANQPLPLKSHIQTKQVIMSALRSTKKVLQTITNAGFSYPEKKLCQNVVEIFAKCWTLINYGSDLIEDQCELTCDVLEEYLKNPEKATDLNSSSWYVLLSSLAEILMQNPSYSIPAMTLFQRVLPCSPDDPYLKIWRVVMEQDFTLTENILEFLYAFAHSGHVEVSELATNVLLRISMIRSEIISDLSTKIRHKFAPISSHENGEPKPAVEKTKDEEKFSDLWNWRRSAKLLGNIIQPKSYSAEETNALIDASLMAVTKAAIDCHSEHDNSPTSSVVGLFFTLAETGHLTNTEYISILTTGCDLIAQKRPMSMGMMSCLMELIILAGRRGNLEVKKLLREKIQRFQLKQFLSSYFGHIARVGKKVLESDIFILYNFIRMIVSSLEKTDLTPIFQGPDSPFKGFMKTWAKISTEIDETERVKIEEVDQFFMTLTNPFFFEIDSPAIKDDSEEFESYSNTVDFTGDLVYKTIMSEDISAEEFLLSNIDLLEISRELTNIKLEEDIEKILIEPEMTCITEEDQKQETFSTRIGRSMTLQRRNEQEKRRARAAVRPGPNLIRRPGRPSAMHVDEYNKDESDSDNDRGRHYSGGGGGEGYRGDGYRGDRDRDRDRSQSPRYRDPRDRGDHHGGYRGGDRDRDRTRSPPGRRGPPDYDRPDGDRGPPRRGGYRGGHHRGPPRDRDSHHAYSGAHYRGSPGRGRGRGFRGSCDRGRGRF